MCDVTTPQAELEKREQSLEALQERVTELKERAKVQETPLQMQVIEMFQVSHGWYLVKAMHGVIGQPSNYHRAKKSTNGDKTINMGWNSVARIDRSDLVLPKVIPGVKQKLLCCCV